MAIEMAGWTPEAREAKLDALWKSFDRWLNRNKWFLRWEDVVVLDPVHSRVEETYMGKLFNLLQEAGERHCEVVED